jgi:hypothetical protein
MLEGISTTFDKSSGRDIMLTVSTRVVGKRDTLCNNNSRKGGNNHGNGKMETGAGTYPLETGQGDRSNIRRNGERL